MNYFRKKLIQERLYSIPDTEWDEICNRCKRILAKKLHYTKSGAHSEKELGMPAIDYYLNNSIEKIFTFQWDWKFEKYSIVEQLIRIAGSLISKNVEKYLVRQGKGPIEIEHDDERIINIFDEDYDDRYDELIKCIELFLENDEDLKLYWESIKEGYKSKDIAELFGKPVNMIYRLNEKFIYQSRAKCLNSH